MRFILFLLLTLSIYLPTTTARAEDTPSPVEAAWLERTMVPEAIGRIHVMDELINWCGYEQHQPQPDKRPCEQLEKRKSSGYSAFVVDTGKLIKTTLAYLKAEPQTPIVKEQIAALTIGLKEIMDNLRPVPEVNQSVTPKE